MTKITVLGGTGYTGANIAREAVSRGHEVTSFSRTALSEPVAGVSYETGSLLDDAVRRSAVQNADVVLGALSPRGELAGALEDVYARFEELSAESGARFVVIGGFSTLRPAEGAPRFVHGDGVPAEFADEAREMTGVLEHLLSASPTALDWLYVSPAATYGSYAPGEATGAYRTGGEVALFDEAGESAVSGADFALAVVDEIDKPSLRRAQLSVAY
ncbi:NAD(P)-dependent oxidoreductase [Leifsonia poae]|uniref:NAD(P)-dependent oxidoreductase n=1 Tax=Leifsonia poae TaxID=110933 RepID=UPI001CC10419|nr:NAD(P)H-binding protein [Leifsonia poae]